jgi:galactose-1-phosphate uridylyltransferase
MAGLEQVPHDVLGDLVEVDSVEELSTEQILSSFRTDRLLENNPDTGKLSVDPRSGEPVIYNPSRASRPHDYPTKEVSQRLCPICAGDTTGIIDLAELQEGYTFINKNLYPVVNFPTLPDGTPSAPPRGLHFVQWTSSFHDQDWHNLPDEDCQVVLSRLAGLERKLLSVGQDLILPDSKSQSPSPGEWYISIIKNVGSAVGGSLEHGHQQIILSDIAPRRILNNQKFLDQHGQAFSTYLQATNPDNLLIQDYGSAALLVCKFMRRPYEMVLLLKDTEKKYLHQLDRSEIKSIALGWKHASRAIRGLMPLMNREVAFNVVAHNGPGAGLYFEFLPYTQEQGGLEQLGLSVCQMEPEQAAQQIRAYLQTSEV